MPLIQSASESERSSDFRPFKTAKQDIRKPSYEYKFVEQLSNFIQTRREDNNIPGLFEAALKVFYPVFERGSIRSCSVYFSKGTEMGIRCAYVRWPTDENYMAVLEKGEGITGLVCQDMSPRYVPRLFLPFATQRGCWQSYCSLTRSSLSSRQKRSPKTNR